MPHKGKPAAAAVVHAHLDAKGLVQETIAWDVRLSLNDCLSAGLKCYKKVFPLLLCKNTTELFQSAKAPQGLKVLAVQGHVRAAHFEQLRAPCCHLGLGRFLFGFGPREQLIHRRHHVGHSPADLGQRQRKITPPTKARREANDAGAADLPQSFPLLLVVADIEAHLVWVSCTLRVPLHFASQKSTTRNLEDRVAVFLQGTKQN